jgi:hypothetical protein
MNKKIIIFLCAMLSVLAIGFVIWFTKLNIIGNIGILLLTCILFAGFGVYLKNKHKHEIAGEVIFSTFSIFLFLTLGYFIYYVVVNVRC